MGPDAAGYIGASDGAVCQGNDAVACIYFTYRTVCKRHDATACEDTACQTVSMIHMQQVVNIVPARLRRLLVRRTYMGW